MLSLDSKELLYSCLASTEDLKCFSRPTLILVGGGLVFGNGVGVG